jgi:hypothetical protein
VIAISVVDMPFPRFPTHFSLSFVSALTAPEGYDKQSSSNVSDQLYRTERGSAGSESQFEMMIAAPHLFTIGCCAVKAAALNSSFGGSLLS